jgi:hypothetical protein
MKNGTGHGASVLDKMLEPVSRSFGVKTARSVAALRVGTKMQARADKLAEKCDAGKLTVAERAEYEAYIQASTLIGILQAKARRTLAKAG